MNTLNLDRATFASVYRFLQNKQDTYTAKCFQNLFRISLLFFPAFICPDVAVITGLSAGASLAGIGAGKAVKDAAENAFSLFKHKSYEDYYTRYEQMQIAQVMLIYASYFDTISQYLPNENGEVELSPDIRLELAQASLKSYCQKLESSAKKQQSLPRLLEEEISLPNPTETFAQYEMRLLGFYCVLNEQFIKFFEQLPFWKSLRDDRNLLDKAQKEFFRENLNNLPKQAVSTYRREYFTLSKTFPDFAVWANHEEHRRLEEQIDVGFTHIADRLRQCCYFIEQRSNIAAAAMEQYHRKYINYLQSPIIDHSADFDTSGVVFPTKRDIFIPQSFKAITYHNNMTLESKDSWRTEKSREEIGKYIHSILSHPTYGQNPLLILGHPGAGKTLLCHMLAAQVLFAEYHVIIIRLRDTAAEDDITQQINSQIARDLGDNCRWNDIRNAELDKAVLLIFDGYDELLQASGKTYSNYLNEIARFQSEQRNIHRMLVRCIVTSRVTLIDKASIPENSQVLHLNAFDNTRIQRWIDIWNSKNESFFTSQKANKLEITSDSKVKDLARQPLLLLMLALYTMNGNDLRGQTDISYAELYYKLIRDFVIRENEKDTTFGRLTDQKKKEAIYKSLRNLGIVALGMYNRKQLVIRSTELKVDLAFLSCGEVPSDFEDAYTLEKEDKLIGSFFFVHSSKSIVRTDRFPIKVSAYEFLHNTFGEFLTAYYILDVVFRLARRQLNDTEMGETFSWPNDLEREWHTCLAYVPLCTRPVVLNMIHEFSPLLAKERQLNKEYIQIALDALFSGEIRRLISGGLFACLNKTLSVQGNPFKHPELTMHVSTYSINLILLRSTVCTDSFVFTDRLGTKSDWNKMTRLWRYAFSEEELVVLSCMLQLSINNGIYQLRYQYDKSATDQTRSITKLDRMYRVADVLGDNTERAVFGVLNKTAILHNSNSNIYIVLEKEQLKLKTMFALNSIENILTSSSQNKYVQSHLVEKLHLLLRCSYKESDYWGIYIYCSLLTELIAKNILEQKYINTLLDQKDLLNLEQEITQCARVCYPFNQYCDIRYLKLLELITVIFPYTDSEIIFDILEDMLKQVSLNLQMRSQNEANKRKMKTQVESFKNCINQLFSQYCHKVEKSLKWSNLASKHKDIENLCRVSKLFAKFISWRGFSCLLHVCKILQEARECDFVYILMECYLNSMEDDLFSIFNRIKKKDRPVFLNYAIDCYYRIYLSSSQQFFVSDDSQIIELIFCKLDSLTMLLPSYESSLSHFLWLLCEEMSYIPWPKFDLRAELYQVLTKYASSLSVQTLQQILTCVRKFGYRDLEMIAIKVVSG
ncbi:MAG: hypothetical protein HFF17_14230 [Oscillospiraceae bacterium]|nr:hypothetical protein [Oscillospiraceae bacterium]MCI9527965.1 hypothetical protein [Lachnospiraceae bacterium]